LQADQHVGDVGPENPFLLVLEGTVVAMRGRMRGHMTTEAISPIQHPMGEEVVVMDKMHPTDQVIGLVLAAI